MTSKGALDDRSSLVAQYCPFSIPVYSDILYYAIQGNKTTKSHTQRFLKKHKNITTFFTIFARLSSIANTNIRYAEKMIEILTIACL